MYLPTSRLLPPMPREASVSIAGRQLRGRFQVLMVSTLHALVLTGRLPLPHEGSLGLVAMERRRMTVLRSVIAGFMSQGGLDRIPGLHFEAGDAISFDEQVRDAIMDGETFTAAPGRGIDLMAGPRVRFVDLTPGRRAPAHPAEETGYAAVAGPQLAGASPLWNSQSRP